MISVMVYVGMNDGTTVERCGQEITDGTVLTVAVNETEYGYHVGGTKTGVHDGVNVGFYCALKNTVETT